MTSSLKYIFLTIFAACTAITALASGEDKLTFVKADGTTVSFSTSGLIITYDDSGHAIVNNDETSTTLDLEDMNYMCFGDVAAHAARDVNGDGEVNIADVNTLIDLILGGMSSDDTARRADVNGDGEVNIADVNTLIDLILKS